MLTFIISAFLGGLCALSICPRMSSIERKVTAFIGALVGVMLGIVAALVISDVLPHHEFEMSRTQLAAMRNQSGVSGQFILGTGTIESASTYRFLMQDADGGMTPREVSADNMVRIFEEEGQSTAYYTEIYRVRIRGSYWDLFVVDVPKFVRHEFHVPKGTVVHQFKID